MGKREFVMLAHNYRAKKDYIEGWYMSEKLDGMYAVWDGGVSRGYEKASVPWANTSKDDRYIDAPIATGLWSRYANVIHAPDWWLDALPDMPLCGELYSVNHSRQQLLSAVKKLVPDDGWNGVTYNVYGSPPIKMWLADGQIKTLGYTKVLKDAHIWAYGKGGSLAPGTTFSATLGTLKRMIEGYDDTIILHPQVKLPIGIADATAVLDAFISAVRDKKGEGVILVDPQSCWVPERSRRLLKIKDIKDDEATVIGYTTGRATALGSKLLGMMGQLMVRTDGGVTFGLSGFTDAERTLVGGAATAWATDNPGAVCPDWISNISFPRGTRVTYTYNGLTDGSAPMEARYWRRFDG